MNNHLLHKKKIVALKLFSYNFFINHGTTTVLFVYLIILTTISMVVVNVIQGMLKNQLNNNSYTIITSAIHPKMLCHN